MAQMPLILLHLSDIHFAKPAIGDAYDLDVDLRRSLEADAKVCREKIGTPDAILISGDIAFSGKREQYSQARSWLDDELCKAVACDPASVWTVAGNHDVDQSIIRAKPTYQDVRMKFRDATVEQIDSLWEHHLKEPELFYGPLTEYNKFAAEIGCQATVDKPRWDTSDRFKLNDGTILRIFGLNSSLISDNNDDIESGKMAIGTHQCQLPTTPGVENLLMCHHPPDWMRDGELAEETFNPRTRLQLFGHKHKHNLKKIDDTLLRVSAGAVHPSRNESGWEPRYNWMCIWVDGQTDNRQMHVNIYPRIWNRGRQTFDADWSSIGGGSEFKHDTLTLEPLPTQVAITRPLPKTLSNESIVTNAEATEGSDQKTSEVSDNRGVTVSDPERTLARRYFQLGYVDKIRIATDLQLLDESDDDLADQERQAMHLVRAKEKQLLGSLWQRVQQTHNDGRYPSNPFE